MNTEQQALLRTILENPDDDAPRLVYADWLDERGDADNFGRARLIRLQIAGQDPEVELLEQADNRWVADWLRGKKATWARGFIQEVQCESADWVEHADEVLMEHPIKRVTLLGSVVPDHLKVLKETKDRGIEVDWSKSNLAPVFFLTAVVQGLGGFLLQGLNVFRGWRGVVGERPGTLR
jgi:uncharacterized protein (TIGR02996 family)